MSWAAQLVIAVAVFLAGMAGGVKYQLCVQARVEVDRLEQVREIEVLQRGTANTASTGHEADKTRVQTKFITITDETERVVNKIEYRDRACLDPAGVQNLNAAVRAANDSGELGDALPGAD